MIKKLEEEIKMVTMRMARMSMTRRRKAGKRTVEKRRRKQSEKVAVLVGGQ